MSKKTELLANIDLHNRFDIEVIDTIQNKIKQKAQGYNIICNQLWTKLCTGFGDDQNYFKYIFYGSGTGTPQASDTALFHHEGAVVCGSGGNYNDRADDVEFDYNLQECWASVKRQIQLSESTAVGINLTEVGIGYGSSASNLCTHAMLQDMNGNPISILKTNTDIINIYATVYVHWSTSQRSLFYPIYQQKMGSSGTTVTGGFRSWVLGLSKYQGINMQGYGSGVYLPTSVLMTKESWQLYNNYYINRKNNVCSVTGDASTKQVTFNPGRYIVSEANAGGIGTIWLANCVDGYSYTYPFLPAIKIPITDFFAGNDIVNESVGTGDGITTEFELDFDFAENAKIYINGIEQASGVTINKVPTGQVQLRSYVKQLMSNSTLQMEIDNPTEEGISNSSMLKTDAYILTSGRIIKNTLAPTIGFSAIESGTYGFHVLIYGSDDLANWTLVYEKPANTYGSRVNITTAQGHYKYYKNVSEGSDSSYLYWETKPAAVIFDTPPADGDVITADYHTPYIAKDEDHVLDVSFTLQFGEYTP